MRPNDRTRFPWLVLALVVAAAPTAVFAGIQAQGIQAQGIQAQGIQAQGIQAQGIQAQGIQAQGIQAQGIQAQGVALGGTDLLAADIKGVDIGSVQIRGLTADSAIVSHELTRRPDMSTGTGDYISISGESAVNHYAVAHLVDVDGNPAEDIDLFIAGEQKDPEPNLFHSADDELNRDVALYDVYFFHRWSGQWMSLCPFDDATGGATAMALAEDPANPQKFIFACTATGVAAKCARRWGFRPWQTAQTWVFNTTTHGWEQQTHDLRPYYEACKVAARAAYCQDTHSFTKNGTLVDLYDTRQYVWPNPIENPFNAANPDSLWMFAQEFFVETQDMLTSSPKKVALQRSRWRELDPVGTCNAGALASIERLEHDHFEDGRWANPLTGQPRIQVFSPNYCTHHEDEPGPGMPWDCSPCTTAVCKVRPSCCNLDPTVNSWDAACVTEAHNSCELDNALNVVHGKVWPEEAPATSYSKYLYGPAGAVESVSGVSAGGAAVTVAGWACDPEWPGTGVTVQVYGGAPREQPGATLLGEMQAALPLGPPLLDEVKSACDGPGGTSARHGFSFTLPAGVTGNVYVYALDAATLDGPPAPPTLLRNGIVDVPTCAHSEHVAGAALDAACSSCVAKICAPAAHPECCDPAQTWTDSCVAAAADCSAADSSSAVNDQAFSAVTTGWLEAPTTGTFVFQSLGMPSRLFINGQPLFDWFEAPGTTSGSVFLIAGVKYHLRWDRFQSEPPAAGTLGLTWQVPGTAAQAEIPANLLYRVSPGLGSGLLGSWSAGFINFRAVSPSIDFSATNPPPAPAPATNYNVTWIGEIVPFYTETYTFFGVSSGDWDINIDGHTGPQALPAMPAAGTCSHSLCELGSKLADDTNVISACDPCVHQICSNPDPNLIDPYCCNGGYLSYYSTEPEWDAKCVAEVTAICGIPCPPTPSPVTKERKLVTVDLEAGVHYRIRLHLNNPTTDATVQLLWESKRQHKDVVPSFALFPVPLPGTPPVAAGAGLNVTLFAPAKNGDELVADLHTPVASGAVPDLSLAARVGVTGTSLDQVLAPSPASDAVTTPPPPLLVQPRFGGHVEGSPSGSPGKVIIPVNGVGAVAGGKVLVFLGGSSATFPVGPDGSFKGEMIAALGPGTMKLRQTTDPADPCPVTNTALCSRELTWDITVDPKPATAGKPPSIQLPHDLTALPDPAANVVSVAGQGTPGSALTYDDVGGAAAHIVSTTVGQAADGAITGKLTLTEGSVDPTAGWHKLTFTENGASTAPIFVSVGIDPPTVIFPRTGAELECRQPNESTQVTAVGKVRYAPRDDWQFFVREETGRLELGTVGAETRIITQTPLPDGTFAFITSMNLPPGKHLLYFFQAPPIDNMRPEEAARHLRAFSRIASTPTSRIEVRVPPPTLGVPQRRQFIFSDLPGNIGPFVGSTSNCPGMGVRPADCAEPFADVVVHVGKRTFVARADKDGNWTVPIPETPGWHHFRLGQVSDMTYGGGWQESCPSDDGVIGITHGGRPPVFKLPQDLVAEAQSPAGAPVFYQVSATTADGQPATVDCAPASGSVFRIGETKVLCTAVDPNTHDVGLDAFLVTVVDGPPHVKVPAAVLTAEADRKGGALVMFDVTADDAVDGPLPVTCVPASGTVFPIDQDTKVTCMATDSANNTGTGEFLVRVQDTRPPVLCPLPDVKAEATSRAGAIVNYATCANDVVDGAVPVVCDRPSGSLFPVGKTLVTCTARDSHGNLAPPASFTVSVGDTTPPVLKLPTVVDAVATCRQGARVSYTVTATDNTDPAPKVACTPPSGSVFPLGSTTVTCKATDRNLNVSTGTFVVRVRVSWSGPLSPIAANGTSKFTRKTAIKVHFNLTGASAGITDLPARLFVAPIDAAGNVGREVPAPSSPASAGNLFRYFGSTRGYELMLDVPHMALGAWRLRYDLGDKEVHTVKITLVTSLTTLAGI